MKLEEFVKLDAKQVRVDKGLMQLYVKYYEAAFSFTPNCVGCSFKSGFRKLRKFVINSKKSINFDVTENISKMEKTFVLKNTYKLKILTYKKEEKVYRSYGYNLTEEFANELVNNGKSEYFSKLPNTDAIEAVEVDNTEKGIDYASMNYRTEVIPLYNGIKEKTGLKAKSFKKEDIIAFIKEHEG